jgi:hypothetical protein
MSVYKMSGKKVGFVTMGKVKPKAEEIPEMGVGMLGYAFMGKAHSNAFKKVSCKLNYIGLMSKNRKGRKEIQQHV